MAEENTTNQTPLEEAVNSPLEVETREGRVKNHTIQEQIKADQYTSLKNANRAPYGIVIARTVHTGQYG